jgi:hypothetical protein
MNPLAWPAEMTILFLRTETGPARKVSVKQAVRCRSPFPETTPVKWIVRIGRRLRDQYLISRTMLHGGAADYAWSDAVLGGKKHVGLTYCHPLFLYQEQAQLSPGVGEPHAIVVMPCLQYCF